MHALGTALPALGTALPGARSSAWVDELARTECPALTARRARRAERSGASADPIVWTEARGANVRDADGNVFVDMTAGFGVAALGHAHPVVVEAIRAQSERLVHGLGDVHPSDVKIRLLSRLAALSGLDDARVILGAHGADAIEAALQTALLATGRPGVVAFEGGYHGLSLGALSVCGYSAAFRGPFAPKLDASVRFVPFPARHDGLDRALAPVEALLRAGDVGAVLVEPIQGRGGVNVPPDGFLAALGALTRAHGALLVVDEIFTGLGRTGPRFRGEADGERGDLVCVGKALGGGLPISACIGAAQHFAGWSSPTGEALRTATFLGHPLACAASLAILDRLEAEAPESVVAARGQRLVSLVRDAVGDRPGVLDVRGAGMLVGVTLDRGARTLAVVRRLLERGWITLPAGASAETLELSPPLDLPDTLAAGFAAALRRALEEVP